MRQDILDIVERKTESRIGENRGVDDNPMYEDPRDVIGKICFCFPFEGNFSVRINVIFTSSKTCQYSVLIPFCFISKISPCSFAN